MDVSFSMQNFFFQFDVIPHLSPMIWSHGLNIRANVIKLSLYIFFQYCAIGLLYMLLIYFELSFGFGMVQGPTYDSLYIDIHFS